ncbi:MULTISPECIES: pantothenate kinase [unclassified Tolypothrix]|uniref:pantothenate kinase n=2 Tax=Tolypothrix TaxID=111782 RepID=UPI000BBC2E6F|nr:MULTISPECIES: pantothenate kinase [unclassified Tolypothrix]UYD30173.1 pantothenate kinase [Tolypothrix sp. PCC 7712]UYD37892.1 pantothenate kinase [Tolypothrix sp. PCC 7601]
MKKNNIWLALEIGNSRLHWALFFGSKLDYTWDTEYLSESVIQQLAQCQTLDDLPLEVFPPIYKKAPQEKYTSPSSPSSPYPLPLAIASVVPSQTVLWQSYPNVRVITLDQILLKGLYPTLGIDRALALWGAGKTWGFPMLVIDAGTALTFTAADAEECLVGGAILPGLGLQFTSLGQKTGQLPLIKTQAIASLPPRFALNTTEAIQSGVIYTILAGIKDFIENWWQLFPEGKIAIKGGDRTILLNYLQALYPAIASRLTVEPNLIFWGIEKIVRIP